MAESREEFRNKDKASGSRLVVGQYFADIVADPRSGSPGFHWVVQKFGCADVVWWGQESTFEAAEKSAYEFLHEQMVRNAKQTG